MKICKKLCDECPFSRNSAKGWIASYSIDDFMEFMRYDLPFPCHMLVEHDMTAEEAAQSVIDGKMKLCRGYVESMRKSAKIPRDPELAAIVASVNPSDDVMSIFEFAKHHTINK